MLSGHLNASYNFGLTGEDVGKSMVAGYPVVPTLGELFIDAHPSLIVRAMREAGATPESVTSLYRSLVREGAHRVQSMESLIREWFQE